MHFAKPPMVSMRELMKEYELRKEKKLREELEPPTYEEIKAEYRFKKAGMLFVYKLENYICLSKKDRKNLPEKELLMVNKYTDLFKKASIKRTVLFNLLQIYKKKVIRTEYHPQSNTLGSNCGEIVNLQKTVLLEKTFQIFKKLKNFDKSVFDKIVSDMIKIEKVNFSDVLLNDYLLMGSLLENPTFLKTKHEIENIILQQKVNQR